MQITVADLTPEISPCFCGGESRVTNKANVPLPYIVECSRCPGLCCVAESLEMAVGLWNKRVAEIEALRPADFTP